MSLTARDRKILILVAPLAVLLAYWFLLLAPQRNAAAAGGDALVKQEQARDQAQARAGQLESAKSTFATDFASMVRLGKAVPTTTWPAGRSSSSPAGPRAAAWWSRRRSRSSAS